MLSKSEYIVGSPYQGTPTENVAIAKTLAQMHLASMHCVFDFEPPYESLLDIVVNHIKLARQQPSCTPCISRILDTLEGYSYQNFITPEVLPQFPVHGDFIPWNLAIENEFVVAIYDFDNCCMDSRLHDLGEALVAFFALDYMGQSSQLKKGVNLSLPEEEMYAFLQNYHATSPLSPLESKLLPVYVLGAWWESILLSFIRGEQDVKSMQKIVELPEVVSSCWNQWGTVNILKTE